MRIQKLQLTTFRNMATQTMHIPPCEGGQVVAVLGPNGAGKTSVLEALSLLSPGRGLHKAKIEDIAQNGGAAWGIYAELADGTTIGQSAEGKMRRFKIDGVEVEKQSDLATVGHVMWLTPRQDRLFLDGPAARREFFDRLVYGLNPLYAEALARYKHHARARLKLLKDGATADWVALEEQQAAHWGVQVLAERQAYMAALAPHMEEANLRWSGATLDVLDVEDAVAALAGKFERSRLRDAEVGATHTGPQKIDVTGTLTLDGHAVPLAQVSSGQHKRALVQLILAHARLMTTTHGQAPLVLIDEVAAHLDEARRAALLAELTAMGAQIWVSETEVERLGEITCVEVLLG